VRDTLGAIQARFSALKLDGGAVHISRLGPGPSRRAMRIKSVVMYSAAWVKQQARMASTSNQETFRADVEGRVVLDVLRQVGGRWGSLLSWGCALLPPGRVMRSVYSRADSWP
jgi:DNA polymerase delta subunit 1